ncbi:MAG TPA: hypothetical protein VMR81_07180 [Patescibacteria group bacterium]|nr:hypothetical protein [Patescibacteria group bacterium]
MTRRRASLFPFLLGTYSLVSIGLFLFSYTQVDLSLTLSQVSIFQMIEKIFQHIGFYQRPVATSWFIGLLIVYFALYAIALIAVKRKLISTKQLWTIIIVLSVLTIFSYPAFSYDIYNYMFTAKTVLVYHKNPYMVIPLQFTGVEPWLSFMRWTHLPSAYTPLWIFISLPAYILGFGYFLLILENFKLLALGFYLLTIWFIAKILDILDVDKRDLGVAIFALNPLVIFETLVSAHNDIEMMAFAMMSLFFYITKKRILAYLFLALSVGAKLMTLFLYPVIVFGYRRIFALIAMCVGLILVLFQREVLAWYFIWIMPFIALLPDNEVSIIVAFGVSLGLLLRYAPYFYYGDWNKPVPTIELWVTLIPIGLSMILYATQRMIRHKPLF